MSRVNSIPIFLVYLLRFLSAVIGTITLVLISHSNSSSYAAEILFLGCVIFTFVISVFFLLYHVAGFLDDENPGCSNYADMSFHFVGGLSMVITGIFMLGVAIDHPAATRTLSTEKVLAAVFGIENGLTYSLIGYVLYRKLLQIQAPRHGEGLEWEDPLLASQESNKSTTFGSI